MKVKTAWWGLAAVVPLLSVTGRALQGWVGGLLTDTLLAWLLGGLTALVALWAGWRLPAGCRWIGLWALAMVVGLALWWVPHTEEQIHFVLFGSLGYLAVPAWGLGRGVAACAALAVGDEALQAILPYRVGEWRDVAVNALSSGVGLVVAWASFASRR